jgi:ribonuclease Z
MSQRLIVLGAGTALPDRDRDNTFLVWDSPAGGWLIDCAGRAYQQLLRAEVDPRQLRGMILTHNHPDHIYGVPALLFHLWLAGREQPFEVFANAPTLAMGRALCEALELEQHGHMCPTSWHELPQTADHLVVENESYSILTAPVRHTRPTLGLKFIDHTQQDQTIVYSCDTEPCPELEQFAQGAHTLIHEATVNDPVQNHGHTTPRQAGEIGARCGVRRLALIHYSAEYTLPEDQAIAEVRAGGFEGEVALARELEAYHI